MLLKHNELLKGPGEQSSEVDIPRHSFNTFGICGMGDPGKFLVLTHTKQCATVSLKKVQNPCQGLLDLSIDLAERCLDETGRQVRDQRLEAHPPFEHLTRSFAVEHASDDRADALEIEQIFVRPRSFCPDARQAQGPPQGASDKERDYHE